MQAFAYKKPTAVSGNRISDNIQVNMSMRFYNNDMIKRSCFKF